MEALVNNVLASIRPKIINGKSLTGAMLLNLLKSYLQAINTGGVPQILTSMERVINSEMKRVYYGLLEEYKSLVIKMHVTKIISKRLKKNSMRRIFQCQMMNYSKSIKILQVVF